MKWLGIIAVLATLMASASANAEVTSHPTICRNWGNIAMGVYARYQTKYKTVFALLAFQARDEEADARRQGWTEDNIKQLLMVVSNAQSGQWNDVNKFGEDEFNDCIAQWKASSDARRARRRR
jgi:hypothetical protein